MWDMGFYMPKAFQEPGLMQISLWVKGLILQVLPLKQGGSFP